MSVQARSITFGVYYKNSMGAESIGFPRIAVSDFPGGSVPDSYLQFLNYRQRDKEGRRNGIINFTVRVKTPEYSTSTPKPAVGAPANENGSCGYQMRVAKAKKNSNEVVVGIPICWKYTRN